MRRSTSLIVAGAWLVAGACADPTPLAPTFAADAALRSASVVLPPYGPWAKIVEGETGPGSRYALYVPSGWNGDAVYYVHGIRDVDSPIDLRDQDNLYAARDLLGAMGFAFAYSSFSENGYAVKDGAQRTHQLRGLLHAQLNGPPARNFLVSHSVGSAIALHMAETYPTQYDGAFLMCGLVGGSLLQTQYAGHVRALADVFFPGALPGNVLGVPSGFVATLPQVIAMVSSNPAGLFAIASIKETPLPYVPSGSLLDPTSIASQTLVGSLYGPLSYQTRFANNFTDLLHGQSSFDNAATVYSLSASPLFPGLQPLVDLANATVTRYRMPPAAFNYLNHYYSPSGDLRIPVLTLHNTWDPGVPAFHEQELLQRVTSAGRTGSLLQRLYPAYGHCAFPAPVAVQNFLDMVAWVTTGVKPAN